jgi:transposase InsO family protein
VTIEKFRQAFATHGIPDVLVTDNGTCFTSHEFAIFTSENGIQHVKTSPYHPASNGLAERAVRIFKEGMKKMDKGHGSLTTKLQRFLLNYRTTPQTTTGVAPAELLMNRKLRTKLDFVKPEIRERVGNRQRKFKQYHDLHAKGRTFMEGDAVMTKSFPSGRWKCGEITQQTGPVSYKVAFPDGVTARRHVDHIKQRHFIPQMEADNPDESGSYYEPPTVEEAPRSATAQPESEFKANASLPLPSTSRPSSVPTVASPRRSSRSTKKPAYLDDYVTP